MHRWLGNFQLRFSLHLLRLSHLVFTLVVWQHFFYAKWVCCLLCMA